MQQVLCFLPMPLIIAHRGASAYAPENTLAAFDLAHRQGADMIELDVQRSADGVLVVFHDLTTERWDVHNRPVAQCSLAELRRLDLGGERLPTLAETLDLARGCGIALNVELKVEGIGQQCATMLGEFGMHEQTIISSFLPAALREVKVADPRLRCGYLMGTRTYHPVTRLREFWPFLALKHLGVDAWHPSHELPGLLPIIPLVRRAGYAVHVWTVDEPVVMQRLAQAGVSGIITNRPDMARTALRHEWRR